MGSFEVKPQKLIAASKQTARLAKRTRSDAMKLEGESDTPAAVGDVQQAAGYQQAVYDWIQTRFEDLMASELKLGDLATGLNKAAAEYLLSDDEAAKMMSRLLQRLDATTTGPGHGR